MSVAPDGQRPPSSSDIFRVFVVIGLTAFGGGASAHIHDAVVRRRGWLDEKRMLEGMTLARVIPGTNVSNLAAFVGAVLAGWRGAVAAVCGVVLPGLVAILALAALYGAFAEHGQRIVSALSGLTAGAVGIMVSLVADASRPVRGSGVGLALAAAAFVAVGVLQLNMLLVLVVLTPLGAWLGRGERTP
jgi:chromate transporter